MFFKGVFLVATGLSAFGAIEARCQEVTTYRYDALGRLVQTSVSGGPADGISSGTCFDAAGNRLRYVVGGSNLPLCVTQVALLEGSKGPKRDPGHREGK